MHPNHKPKIDTARGGIFILFRCKCGKHAYMDVVSGQTRHADRFEPRSIPDTSVPPVVAHE